MESLLLEDLVGDDVELELLRRFRDELRPERLRLLFLASFRFFLEASFLSFFMVLKNSSSLSGAGSSSPQPCLVAKRFAVLIVRRRP